MLSKLQRHPDLWMLAALLLVALAPRTLVLLRAPAFITNDSLSYLLPGHDLSVGEGFEPIFKRPPAYPVMLAAVLWTMGRQSLDGILLVQHGLGIVLVLVTYGLARSLFGRTAGLIAGLLTAISGPLLITEHYIMSEMLFAVLLIGAVFVAIGALRRRSLWFLAATGFLLGLAALARPVAQLLVPVLAVLSLIYLPRWRHAILGALVVVVTYGAAVLPWMARNSSAQQNFTLAGGLGEGLAVRTIRYGQEFDYRAPRGSEDRLRSERKIYRDEADKDSVFDLARRLREELNLSPAEADRAMRDLALQAIVQKPDYYLLGSWDMFAQMFAGRPVRLRQDWQPWRGIVWEERVDHLLPSSTAEQDRAFQTVQTVVTLYDPARWSALLVALFVLGCIAAATGRERTLTLLPAAVAITLLLASAFLVGIEWRYRYPLDPLIHTTVGGGLVWLVSGLRRTFAPRGRQRLTLPTLHAERRSRDDEPPRGHQGPARAEP